MTDMATRYQQSTAPHVVASKQIPDNAVNFIDQQNTFQTEFTPNETRGNPTHFTDVAQNYYSNELKMILIPDNFQPTEPGVPLNRWTPTNKYYDPGSPK